MRTKIYNSLVNRHPGITQRYHKLHDGTTGGRKFLSYLYLLWLNFAYYVLFCRFLGRKREMDFYEEKKLLLGQSESWTDYAAYPHLTPEYYHIILNI